MKRLIATALTGGLLALASVTAPASAAPLSVNQLAAPDLSVHKVQHRHHDRKRHHHRRSNRHGHGHAVSGVHIVVPHGHARPRHHHHRPKHHHRRKHHHH